MTKKAGEEAKVAIRNIRRDANDDIRKMEKNGISEDESRGHQEEIQKSTDKFIAEVDKVLTAKEKRDHGSLNDTRIKNAVTAFFLF